MRSCAFVLAVAVAFGVVSSVVPAFADVAADGPANASGGHVAVATVEYRATQTGVRILRAGGNAVDAAIAIGYTLAVTYPAAGNVGGGGFMLIRFADGGTHFIDFRETAPGAATRGMYLDAKGEPVPDLSTVGPLSAGVPGTVAGLEYARTEFATMSRKELMHDAIGYAADGITLTAADAAGLQRAQSLLSTFASTARIFTANGAALPAGTVLRQPDLARTLRHIEAEGVDGFYKGDVANALVAATRAGGGIISLGDLARYRAVEREPLVCKHRGTTIVTAPPPSSGGVAICEVLGILGDTPAAPPVRSFENAHLELESERLAFADRNTQLGDPDFVPSPVARLLDPAYLAKLRASIAPERATPSIAVHGGSVAWHEGTNTTNYSVIDAAGTAVDVTYTLNNSYGSGFVAGNTGVLLNDEMDDFTTKAGAPNMFGLVQGAANAIVPGKRPLSSMSPTIVVNAGGHVVLAAGAAGGPRIITATLDIVRGVVDFGEDLGTALAAPRAHMQWLPDVVFAEPDTFDGATLVRLGAAGYAVQTGRAGSDANAVGTTPNGTRVGAHDPRGLPGSAAAY